MTIRIFNPDHDLALAANQKRFTAPHAGRKLRNDLSFIPAIWAEDGDVVVVEDIDEAELLFKKIRLISKPQVEFCTMEQLPAVLKSYDKCNLENGIVKIDAWGWNSSICYQFEKNGVPSFLLPKDVELQLIRDLSNRQFSSLILKELCSRNSCTTCGESVYVTDIVGFNEELLKLNITCVAKAPWSCSGRGVRYFLGSRDSDNTYANTINWATNVIAQQGGIMIEPYYKKVKDFAVEFKLSKNGKVLPLGLSLFDTKNGAYTGNLLATEEEKRDILSHYVDINIIDDVIKDICELTESHLCVLASSNFDVHFGVDMMIVAREDGSGFLLHPCVEINLRRTMGLVALSLSPINNYDRKVMSISYESKKYHIGIKKIAEE